MYKRTERKGKCSCFLNVVIKLSGWITVIALCHDTFQGALVKAKHILQRHKTFDVSFELQAKSKVAQFDSTCIQTPMMTSKHAVL